MQIHRIDHVGIIVEDRPAAKAFFVDLGLEVQGEGELQGCATSIAPANKIAIQPSAS